MTMEVSLQPGFPLRGARPAAPGLFDTADLSGVSTFATPRLRSPAASATGLIPGDRSGDARHCHEMIQVDVPLPSGVR
jgi:hypothetical protein